MTRSGFHPTAVRSLAALVVGCGLAAGGALWAEELEIADVFADHAVLQRGVAVPVWGTAAPNAEVTVRFAGQETSVRAGKDGTWRVELSPLSAASEGESLFVESGANRIERKDLLVGEVWYASGQSNMQMKLDACAKKIPGIAELAESPAIPTIRSLRIDELDSLEPLVRWEKAVAWQVDDPETRGQQSAVCTLFARRLRQELGVPIGIIDGSWGGKPIEGFIPESGFQIDERLQAILSLSGADRLEELARIRGGVVIRNTAGRPARIFNARVAPVAPFAIRGFLWYQGESNAGKGEDPREYRIKMRALVEGWRHTWGSPDLPCYFVQLPAFERAAPGWVRLREEQRRSLAVDGTGMAVTIDLRDSDIHPANKLDVANRLASLALAGTYGRDIPSGGPRFESAEVEGDAMRVRFSGTGAGLMVARKEGITAPVEQPGQALQHFAIADREGRWHDADAVIDGDSVVVRSRAVEKPRAVRYACETFPANANLYNREGFPASPFCSELELLRWALPE